MGIPSYFSYIVKNHPELIQKLSMLSINIHNLYMDCNSVIYDVVRSSTPNISDEDIIQKIIQKIELYIHIIKPTHSIFIAFDGVAPMAKLDQQRSRRYKSQLIKSINCHISTEENDNTSWNTTAITPGTSFMDKLHNLLTIHFDNASRYKCNNLILSTPKDLGEGEHKIFKHIRDNPSIHATQTTVIYGLDADLIMLSINHLPITKNIYLFRETPEFIKSIDNSLEPNENYIMDIPNLAKEIVNSMNNNNTTYSTYDTNRIYDYIFLCFFLGNDFMPHFPALNIRTGGIDKLINSYKHTIGNTAQNITDGKTIHWKNLRKVISFLAQLEEKYIIDEDKKRSIQEKYVYPIENDKQKYIKFDAIPIYERGMEKYIHPGKHGWQERYYKILFNIDIDDERRKQICINYLEGLEWTMKYYNDCCPDWNWTYNYHYPPLLQDLIKYIPYFETTFIKPNKNTPITPLTQLCYVLPKNSLNLLHPEIYKKLEPYIPELYPEHCEMIWCYNKYFWESHVCLPHIDIAQLQKIIM